MSSRRAATIPSVFEQVPGQPPNPLASAAVSSEARRQGRNSVPAATVRRPGASPVSLPSSDEVDRLLRIRDFLSFSEAMEDLHGRVHVWVGGHMGQIPYAAFDPIFWAHHTMVDRLWRVWQLRHVGGRPPAAILDDALPPFRMTVRQTLDVTALGYDYAVASASAAAA